MRFSTVASSAILFGAAAMAAPGYNVVYETEVATVTSCKPDVTDCPGKHTPTAPAPVYPPTTTSCTGKETPVYTPPVHPVCPGSPECPDYQPPAESTPAAYPTPAYPAPETPAYPPTYPSGPGAEYPPAHPSGPGAEYPTVPSAGSPYPPAHTPAPVCPGSPECPDYTTPEAPVYPSPTPVCPGGAYCPPEYVPSGTGYPSAPANTSSPYVPTNPPVYTGAASAKSFSLVAVIAAAGAVFLA